MLRKYSNGSIASNASEDPEKKDKTAPLASTDIYSENLNMSRWVKKSTIYFICPHQIIYNFINK